MCTGVSGIAACWATAEFIVAYQCRVTLPCLIVRGHAAERQRAPLIWNPGPAIKSAIDRFSSGFLLWLRIAHADTGA